jgi:small subunit ribosomal protein S3
MVSQERDMLISCLRILRSARRSKKRLFHAGVSKIEIERAGQKIRLIIFTARPGIIIGKKGSEVEKLRKDVEAMSGKQASVDIKEIRKPEIDAQLVAENIALQLEKRVAFRRAMKKSVSSAMRFGALGIKDNLLRQISGAEIARTEWYREGRVPLHTFRAISTLVSLRPRQPLASSVSRYGCI